MCILSRFSLVRLCNSMDCSPLASFVHEVLQGRREEYLSGLLCPPPGDLPNPGIKLLLLWLLHCIQILYCWATGEAQLLSYIQSVGKISCFFCCCVFHTCFFFLSKIIYSVSLNCNSVLAFCFTSPVFFLMITLNIVLRLVMWLHDLDHDMSLSESRKIP